MPTCKSCSEQVEELLRVKIDGKLQKVCADCAERAEEQATVAQDSEAAVQNMMGYKGRR